MLRAPFHNKQLYYQNFWVDVHEMRGVWSQRESGEIEGGEGCVESGVMIGYEDRAYRVMVKSYVSLRFTLLGLKPGDGLLRIN